MEHLEAQGLLIERRAMGDKIDFISLFTAQHGVIRGAAPQQVRGHTPVGSVMHGSYVQRAPSQLGRLNVQLLHPYPAYALLQGRVAIAGIQLLCDLLLHYVPEHVPLPEVFYHQTISLAHGHAQQQGCLPHAHALWEKELLQHLGYLADTDTCYSANCPHPPVYLSPRTARGACAAHGALWKERLLPYPQLWRTPQVTDVTLHEIDRVLPLLWGFAPHVRRSAVHISRKCYAEALQAGLGA